MGAKSNVPGTLSSATASLCVATMLEPVPPSVEVVRLHP